MEQPTQPDQNSSEENANLQAQLADCRAQLEHWQGVATICEMSKQEELGELQKQCDQEIQSLQEALRETVSQYEVRISALQSERAHWKRGGAGAPIDNKGSINKGKSDREPTLKEGQGKRETSPASNQSGRQTDKDTGGQGEKQDCDSGERGEFEVRGEGAESEGAESEGGSLLIEGYFSQHCDTSSLSSFSMDTPLLPRRPPPQEDTASLLSTGTLVPEAIYLPPPGHRLITYSDWDALNMQVSELQGELAQLQDERADLEKELVTHTADTQRQVSVLQSQVQTSEALLQDLQKSLSQSQTAVQSRLADLSLSQKKMCSELSRLRGGAMQEEGGEDRLTGITPTLQGAHCEERLRIEIVNLKEQLETRTEESEVLEVQLSSLKTETDRIQCYNEKLQNELQACRTELSGLRVALAHLQRDSKTQSSDKVALHQQCLELRSQVISLHSQLDTSQTVQRDFVQLSQSLQVKLELIRQAESLDQVKEILGEGLIDDHTKPTETMQGPVEAGGEVALLHGAIGGHHSWTGRARETWAIPRLGEPGEDGEVHACQISFPNERGALGHELRAVQLA
ncbi:hypothetical protein AAFF_G00367000 [Aldrovandia affinis]|uniref:Rab GTPase-binding effector protein 2 n=1 Tax=Aldrovandia affinis TaxID=143900 RepID=A0AAD7SHH9_9TELE|nr:hypothetical protein AAFF_G00367000 [Aldrovandia affinis]